MCDRAHKPQNKIRFLGYSSHHTCPWSLKILNEFRRAGRKDKILKKKLTGLRIATGRFWAPRSLRPVVAPMSDYSRALRTRETRIWSLSGEDEAGVARRVDFRPYCLGSLVYLIWEKPFNPQSPSLPALIEWRSPGSLAFLAPACRELWVKYHLMPANSSHPARVKHPLAFPPRFNSPSSGVLWARSPLNPPLAQS